MNTPKKIGIWMDHSNAEFIRFDKDSNINTIESNLLISLKKKP